MKQFDLSLWLQDKSRKVMTRDGRPVRIVCWDVKGLFPILALIVGNGERDTKVGEEYPCCYKVDGTCPVSDLHDLFFADEEEETEFKKALLAAFDCVAAKAVMTINQPISFQEDVNEWSKELLNLARKELQPEFEKELDKAYKTQDDVVYRNGYAQGKQDALKAALESLPKWKKSPSHKKQTMYGMSEISDVYYNGYFIHLDDIYKALPKEE